MAKKKKIRKRIGKVRSNTSFFKPGESKTVEQFFIASLVQGAFTAIGAVIGTIAAKYLLKEVEQNIPLPAALHQVVAKEAGG